MNENILIDAPITVQIAGEDTDTDTKFGPAPGRRNKPIRVAVCHFPPPAIADADYLEIQVTNQRIAIILNQFKTTPPPTPFPSPNPVLAKK